MKIFIFTVCFFITSNIYGYSSQGVENISNLNRSLNEAKKLGLDIPARERAIKKEIQGMKKKSPKEFSDKLEQKLENSPSYHSFLQEVRDGLNKTEKAKVLAKLVLYEQVKKDWDLLKLTVFNRYNYKDFKQFRPKLIEDLNQAIYVPAKNGMTFEFSNYAIVLVLPSMRTLRWKMQFNAKYDANVLEEGADKIIIQKENESPSGSGLPNPNMNFDDFDF